jgi:hypothetical protein
MNDIDLIGKCPNARDECLVSERRHRTAENIDVSAEAAGPGTDRPDLEGRAVRMLGASKDGETTQQEDVSAYKDPWLDPVLSQPLQESDGTFAGGAAFGEGRMS